MAKMTVGKGLEEYLEKLGNLQEISPGLAGRAIYEGAKIVADQIRSNIQALPVQNGPVKGRRDPYQDEIDGMLEGLGIAKKKVSDGYVDVKIGMDGYNSRVTEKYPKGHPNAMIARSINIGTTFVNRHPFITKAVRATKAQAEEKMKEVIEEGIEETMR